MSGAVFVVAGPGGAQRGPVAALVSTAGWASAATRVLGRSWIVTPGGLVKPEKLRSRATPKAPTNVRARRVRQRLPTPVKTGLKDVRERRRGRRFSIEPDGPWSEHTVRFVWQRHELFQTAGVRLADALGVPSVLFAPATVVWEADRWGTRRPGWGKALEQVGERPALTRAALVACGTEEIAGQVERLGVDPERILVTPTGVDLAMFDFDQQRARSRVRAELEVDDRFVIGWAGSFRRFHALEVAVGAAACVQDASLLLVGDGPERSEVLATARSSGVSVVAPGTVAHHRLPEYLTAMDVGVVLARNLDSFHYSPLKVAEYLAAGVPVVAPEVGQLAERLRDGVDALLVPPGDGRALADALRRLRNDPELRHRLAQNGREQARRSWSWDRQVRRVVDALDSLPASGP